MHKKDVIDYIAQQLDLNKEDSARCLNSIIDQITYGLTKDGEVNIVGFGSFKTREYSARKGVNPKTRESITIEAGKKVVFKPGKNLKELVNN